jgi:holo-[acyl-carrier protein] synthase
VIFGIGTDIVEVARMRSNINRYGDKFAQKILTDAEHLEYVRNSRPAHFLAKRFAAKEAVAKAFGLGFRDGLSLRHIEVHSQSGGKPCLQYSGKAEELCRQYNINHSHLSIADEQNYAIAFVTLVTAS